MPSDTEAPAGPMIVPQEMVVLDLSTIEPHPENPRIGDVGAIGSLIEANGWYGAITVQKSTSLILAGEHRWQALVDAGVDQELCCVIDVDDATARKILAGDNLAHDLGTYDQAGLNDLLSSVGSYEGTGYDAVDVGALIAAAGQHQTAPLDPTPGSGAPPSPAQGVRPIVLPFEIGRYDKVTVALPRLRDEWEVTSNAELFLALIRFSVDEMLAAQAEDEADAVADS